MAEDRNQKSPAAPGEGEMSEAEIDKSLMDSFPASDPPPWTLGTEHRTGPADSPAEQPEPDE